MQNTDNDESMVGMDQCRTSSIESNNSSFEHPHTICDGGVSSSSKPPQLYSQRSRGSHSSSSCGGQEDCLSGGCATEAEPLIPQSTSSDDPKKASAHVNKLHFQLFDHECHDEKDAHLYPKGHEISEVEEEDEEGAREDGVPISGEDNAKDFLNVTTVEMLPSMKMTNEAAMLIRPSDKMNCNHKEKGSNDTVCTASSSTSSAATASSRSSHKSSKAGGKMGRNKNKRLRHLSTDTDDTSDISATLEAPDGGFGWVVVAASFLVNLIADGVTFSFGVFFTEFTTYFKQSEATTSLIGSLLAAMPLLSGPIASSLTDKYGCRNVTIVGGLLAAFGFILSSFTTSIYVLMLTFGVITGFGLSLCYVAAVVIVAYYFDRRRSFATGLSVCGGGIGTFLFAPISQYLIDSYGWQTTTRILAGAFVLLCGCGVLMKDLEWTKRKNKSSNNNNGHLHNHTLSNHGCNKNISCSNNHHSDSDKSNMAGRKGNRRCNSAICIPTFVQEQEQERRERRQRYYSCNQDSGKEDGGSGGEGGGGCVPHPPKHNLILTDRRSPGGKRKSRNVRTAVLAMQGKEIDNNLFSFSFGTSSPPESEERKFSSNSTKGGGLVQSPSSKSSVSNSPMIPGGGGGCLRSPIVTSDQQHLLNPELITMIPKEKDKAGTQTPQQTTLPLPISDNNLTICSERSAPSNTCNGEIDNIAQFPVSPLILDEIKEGGGGGVTDFPQSNHRQFQLNNNNNSATKCGLGDTSISSENHANTPLNFNCISNHHHHIQNQTNNNDSNNSSINMINNSYNTSLSNGVLKNNNSSSQFLHNNHHNSASSFSTTLPPPAPNGIPTIIIPPAQQSKQSVNNVRIDMMNSARYRSVMHRHSLTYRGAVLNLKRYRLRPASSCPDIISVATSADGRGSFALMNVLGDVKRWIQGVCDWENLVNTRFFLFILSNLLLYTWYDVPYMYLQTAAVRHGYSEDLSSYLISSIGLFNVVGNIVLGYMGDKTWASATIVYGICMIICGGTTVLMPYLMEWSYWSLFAICGLFGLTIAANYALTSVILVQVVSLERFASAYGLLLLVQGIGNLVGPPIAGVISDMTGTNTWSFLVAGVGIFASSFFVLAPIFQRELEPDGGDRPVEVGHNNTV